MGDSEGGAGEQDDVSFLRTVGIIQNIYLISIFEDIFDIYSKLSKVLSFWNEFYFC